LAVLGRAYLGADGDRKIHPEAVAPELAGEAATEALRADPSLLDSIEARFFAETEETARRNLFRALNNQTDPAMAARVRTTVPLDPRTRVNEVFGPWRTQLSDRRTRAAAWVDFQKSFDAVVARMPEEYKSFVAMILSSSCDPADAATSQAFFEPRLKQLPGAGRRLKQAVEQIGLCSTLAQAQLASARSYFTK
jgi:alanyl aminopeptidase